MDPEEPTQKQRALHLKTQQEDAEKAPERERQLEMRRPRPKAREEGSRAKAGEERHEQTGGKRHGQEEGGIAKEPERWRQAAHLEARREGEEAVVSPVATGASLQKAQTGRVNREDARADAATYPQSTQIVSAALTCLRGPGAPNARADGGHPAHAELGWRREGLERQSLGYGRAALQRKV